MHSNLISKANLIKLYAVLSLLAILAGCRENAGTSSSSPSKTSLPPTVKAQQETALLPNTGGSFDTSGLLHIETKGVSCPIDGIQSYQNTLVLSTDRLTYDSGEMQQMVAYVDGWLSSQKATPPSTLQEVLGSLYGRFDNWHIWNPSGCTIHMEITNIGKTSFQISKMALRLTANAQQNSYHYRLIDICSLPLSAYHLQNCPPIGRGGGMVPTIYDLKLKRGNTSTLFQGQISPDSSSPLAPTIDPGQAASIVLNIEPSDPSSNLIYSVVPTVTLDIAGEERTIQLVQLSSKIAFVSPSQLSCYGLQGNAFSLLSSGPHKSSWCL